MNWADYGILAIVILSALFGALRGFTREIFGLGTWALAIVVTILFGPKLAVMLQPHIATPLWRTGASYGGLFLGGLLVGGVLTALLVARVRESRFSSTDRTLGAGLGLVRGIIVVGLVVLLARTSGMNDKPWWQTSMLIPPSIVLADGLDAIIPDAWLAPLKPDPVMPISPESAPESPASLVPSKKPAGAAFAPTAAKT